MDHVSFGTVKVTVDTYCDDTDVTIAGEPDHTEADWSAACAYVAGLDIGVCQDSYDDENTHVARYLRE